MNSLRVVARVTVLFSFALGLIACGRTMGYPVAPPPSCTQSIPSESASSIGDAADPLAALEARPMAPPAAATRSCASSEGGMKGAVMPNYGAGVGPVYMSGQDTWYAGGQAVVLMVDARYTGPLLVRPYRVSGGGTTVALVDMTGTALANATEKMQQHGVSLVTADHPSTGGLFFPATTPSSDSRGWIGELSTDGPGWFGFQVDGDTFTEFIVFQVNPGNAPPG